MQPLAQSFPRIEMLVLQSTSFCNIDCSYCYLPHRSSTARMSVSTLEKVFDGVFSSPFLSGSLTVLWHAGEPLVLNPAYYDLALAIIRDRKPASLIVHHNFQTNGTLITQDWANFFLTHGISVGLSIDGPRALHDQYRVNRAGRGTFDQVMRGIGFLQNNKIKFHAITVLTRASLNSARALFDFYLENGITQVGFNIEEIEGDHRSSSLQYPDVEAEIHQFFNELFDLCDCYPGKLKVREFEAAFHAITNPQSSDYGNPLTEPLRMLSVAANGDLSTFSPELLGYTSHRHGSFVFGNIHRNELSSLLFSPEFLAVNSEIERGLEKCRRECEYFDLCRGGAPVNKFFENGTFDSAETMFCRLTKKAVIDVVIDRLERAFDAA
jgi:uncharacterized protein